MLTVFCFMCYSLACASSLAVEPKVNIFPQLSMFSHNRWACILLIWIALDVRVLVVFRNRWAICKHTHRLKSNRGAQINFVPRCTERWLTRRADVITRSHVSKLIRRQWVTWHCAVRRQSRVLCVGRRCGCIDDNHIRALAHYCAIAAA